MSDNNTMNKILVIGSGSRDGAIGKNLIKSLQEKNIKVEKMMDFDFETLSDVNFFNIKGKYSIEPPFYPGRSRKDYKDFTKNSKRFLKGR